MGNLSILDFSILDAAPEVVAPRLLGCELVRTLEGRTLRGRIVETEAYHQTDAASHSFRGKTPRVEVMFGPPGHLYVYFTYGMHYCCNVVCGQEGEGAGVLIRAIEPLEGVEAMEHNRGGLPLKQLTNGPGKVCQALAIDRKYNGHDLHAEPVRLVVRPALPPSQIVQTTRIGISKAVETPWRFYVRDSPYISKRAAVE
jgi:DNA-3-methyladenine glycosylase